MITEYQYNSQDQIVNYTHKGPDDFKRFRNIYDYTGRLYQVDHFYEPSEEDNPDYYVNLLEYNYNENSQTEMLKFNVEMENEYTYNNRNWITAMASNKTAFDYTNSYFRNGNVKTTEYSGEYNNNFGNSSDLTFTYEYDRSNRLLEAVTHDNKFEISNSYDKDGNILTLDRKGSAGSSVDDFNYSYYNGTNKISRVQGSKDQFAYDSNGNLITDSLNSNFSIHYDHRNLITDLIQRVIEFSAITPADTSFYKTYYYYDEAGNRIRKRIFNDENDSLLKDIVYSRGVSGKEMAIYENGSIKQWNIWGMDNAGFITAEGDKRYFLKDHLGSVRAVLDESETVISSQDYDAWGYQMQDRSLSSSLSLPLYES